VNLTPFGPQPDHESSEDDDRLWWTRPNRRDGGSGRGSSRSIAKAWSPGRSSGGSGDPQKAVAGGFVYDGPAT